MHHHVNNPELIDKLRKLHGLPPYNVMSNVCWGDGYFAMSIRQAYTEQQIEAAMTELGLPVVKPSN